MPAGAVLDEGGVATVDPAGNPAPVINHVINFGWEYVWHCHLLGHEENDMMRIVPVAVAPAAPDTVVAAVSGGKNILVTWKDQSVNETGFDVYRKNGSGSFVKIGSVPVSPTAAASANTGATLSFTDTTPQKGHTYTYRVDATDTVGDTTNYGAAPVVGFPQATAESKQSVDSNAVTR